MPSPTSLTDIRQTLRRFIKPRPVEFLQRYFKTGPGEYAAGDKFLGVMVPDTRAVAKQFKNADLDLLKTLIASQFHEERLLALCILTLQYQKGDLKKQTEIFRFYLQNRSHINNWDLIDGSAPAILGGHWDNGGQKIAGKFIKSKNLWERRMAVMASFARIKAGDFKNTLRFCETLLQDAEPLLHKACGWMLREIGNRDLSVLLRFLDSHAPRMPRTMLRYAIEKFSPGERKKYLSLKP